MYTQLATFVAIASSITSGVTGTPLSRRQAGTVAVTPHDQYSSSIGILGCKLANVDRIAYFPGYPDCTNMCKRITNGANSITVLHLDSSGGAHDISYSAYNFLVTGQTPDQNPIMGGPVSMSVEDVPMTECADLLPNGKLPFSAPTGTNQIVACPAGSFTRDNYELYNINTPTCTIGIDEPCILDANLQPQCPSGVGQGAATRINGEAVQNFKYGTSEKVPAAQ